MALSVSCNSSSILRQIPRDKKKSDQWKNVQALVERVGVPSVAGPPLESLRKGIWVKLICGASFEDAVDVRNLSLVYTLAGVDCIDCAADESIVGAVREGIDIARQIVSIRSPWVMISVNDDEDLHFRKAEFNAEECPPDCSRPCETVCPANAISLQKVSLPDLGDSTVFMMNTMYSVMQPYLQCCNLWQTERDSLCSVHKKRRKGGRGRRGVEWRMDAHSLIGEKLRAFLPTIILCNS